MLVCVAAVTSVTRADFALVSSSLSINQSDEMANFNLTFSQVPVFYKVNADGSPQDSFQIEFNGDSETASGPYLNNVTAIVRGDEIHLQHQVVVRQPFGDGGPNSGGWGPIVGEVAFHTLGKSVSFDIPTSDLGWTGGGYQYDAFSLQDGSLTADTTYTVSSIPVPRSFYWGGAGLVIAAVWANHIRKRRLT